MMKPNKTNKIKEITPEEVEFDSNIIKNELCPLLWNNNQELRPEVHSKLLELANRFYKFLGVEVELQSILFTGSLCNFNYNNDSDIDIHLVIDFAELGDPEVVRSFLNSKKYAFNSYREGTRIKLYKPEFYFQDIKIREPHEPTALYDLKTGWVIKAVKPNPDIDEKKIRKLLAFFINAINKLELINDNQLKLERVIEIKNFIVQMRREGVRNQGEYSSSNLTFKELRRKGHIDKLFQTIRTCMDKKLSLENRKPHHDNLLNENFTIADEKQVRIWVKQELQKLNKSEQKEVDKNIKAIVRETMINYAKFVWEKKGVWSSYI